VEENQNVLDLCAAPGGKSLLIRYALGESGLLTCNELSRDRRHRLLGVVDEYIPVEKRTNIKVTGHDASKWCLHEREVYDRILLDAPCSSERHLLHSPKHLKEWSIARTKQLAQRQWSMLSSAFQVLKPGGRMVYSTCALSELENDMVVERLIKKYEGQFSFSNDGCEIGEKTKYGWIILPDVTGFGPIYFCSINKN
jgi:16S rRNA C967 or C1407 C5-methylase (RsmB/RsmF family)